MTGPHGDTNLLDHLLQRGQPTPHCGRMDRHDEHGTCPGVITIEGGSLDTHDCGARVHPSEIRECLDGRCEGTLCPECLPCRRVS